MKNQIAAIFPFAPEKRLSYPSKKDDNYDFALYLGMPLINPKKGFCSFD